MDRAHIVALAVANSPSLTAMVHRARALMHAARAEAQLPSPEVGIEAWDLPLARPYALGEADMYMVELRQRFPAAGSRDARARENSEEAAAVLAEVSRQEQQIIERAAMAYEDYVLALQQATLHQRHLELLQHLQSAIQSRLATGGSALRDVARVELELAQAHGAITQISENIRKSRWAINTLLRRPLDAKLPLDVDEKPETVRLPIDAVLARSRTERALYAVANARIRAAQARREAAFAEARAPEFMLGVGYWQAPSARPGIGANLSMTLPWLWGPTRERVAEAGELAAAQVSDKDDATANVRAEVTEAYAHLRSAEAQLTQLKTQVEPAAERAKEATQAGYASGQSSLLEWLEAARAGLEIEMEAADLRTELARAIIELERAVGAPLPRDELTFERTP